MATASNRLNDETKELMARIAAAASGRLSYERKKYPDREGFERAVYTTYDTAFCVNIVKPLCSTNSGGYWNQVDVSIISEAIRTENAHYGLTLRNAGFLDSAGVRYSVLEKPNAWLKARLAIELDRSGIPELQALSRDFVAELKGDAPVPPLSQKGQGYLRDMQPVPV